MKFKQQFRQQFRQQFKVGGAVAALGICASAALYQPTMARSEEGGNHRPQPNAARPAPPMRPEEMMTQQLNLNADQQAKVKAIFDAEREQMRAIHEKTQAQISALLTADQKAKFEKMSQPGPPGQNRPPEMQDDDHGRPVEQIAKDLGVTPEQFREAFKKVHPAGKGEHPTQEQLHTNHKILAEALGVSIEKLDAVMDKYRPEGPDGRPPRRD